MCGRNLFAGFLLPLCALVSPPVASQTYNLTINAALNKKPISPLIYGVAYATQAQLSDLGSVLNRMGGDNMTRYNWTINADNKANDWYFESIGDASSVPGYRADSFIQANEAAGAQTMMTIPMIPWIAKLGANRAMLDSFSVAKYGPQTATDPWWPDAGNGVSTASGNPFITGNNPADANTGNSVDLQRAWMDHLVSKWGTAAKGGLKYYLMDNESSIWYSVHRDVHPIGAKMQEILYDIIDYASEVKAADSTALVVGPEEWGWDGYLLSGYDQQYGAEHGWQYAPDKAAHGGMDYVPWLLEQLDDYQKANNKRLLDVLSLHCYPADGSDSNDVSAAAQALRNKDTRVLWDPNYTDESWIDAVVELIPRMQSWVSTYYPGTQTAITEYNWGAEDNINGATAQADIDGIFGWQGLNMATRWTCPDAETPTYKAMKMYGNYDSRGSRFGNTGVSDTGSDPDDLSSFAALRSSDGALTIMVINKIASTATLHLVIENFAGNGSSQVWQLTAADAINRQVDIPVTANDLTTSVPGQSITLFVLPPSTTKVVVPATPIGLTGYALNGGSYLTWNQSAGAMSYSVLRCGSESGTYVKLATVDESSFQDSKLTNGDTYWYRVEAADIAGTSALSAPVDVVPADPVTDKAQYNFESGMQGWSGSGGLVTSVGASCVQHFAGDYSLQVGINAAGTDSQTVSVSNPTVPAGSTITFHVWLPAGCGLSSIQPYVLQGAAGNWTWTGNWMGVSSLKLGAWNNVTVNVPKNAAALYSLGVQFNSSQDWSGTCYVDSVEW